MSEWQPIETAPKDGTIIDVWQVFSKGNGERHTDVLFEGGKWVLEDDDEYDLEWGPDSYGQFAKLTHWQPLPEPPTQGSDTI